MLKQEKYYYEVLDKISESLDLCADHEESYKSFKAAQTDPDLDRRKESERSSC